MSHEDGQGGRGAGSGVPEVRVGRVKNVPKRSQTHFKGNIIFLVTKKYLKGQKLQFSPLDNFLKNAACYKLRTTIYRMLNCIGMLTFLNKQRKLENKIDLENFLKKVLNYIV